MADLRALVRRCNCLCRVSASPYPIIGLLLAMVLFGVSNSVFHPADLRQCCRPTSPPSRIGRAFSFHTFAGFSRQCKSRRWRCWALAGLPPALSVAIVAAGVIGLVRVVVPLMIARDIDEDNRQAGGVAPGEKSRGARLCRGADTGHHRIDRLLRVV